MPRKERITHGIFIFDRNGAHMIHCRNAPERLLDLPSKFIKLLERKYKRWWKLRLYLFGKERIVYVEEKIEFTISQTQEDDQMVITLCHPINQFRRKAGSGIVKKRMKWASEHQSLSSSERNWRYIK